MRLFLDTEFVELEPGAKLISIALVDEDENFFYAELTDTYSHDDCSGFVKLNVLPVLKGSDYRMSSYDCAFRLGNWIEDRNVECIIASDNPTWDCPYVDSLLKDAWPVNLQRNLIFPVRISDDVAKGIVRKFGYNIHNALDDAMVMKKATLGY